MCFYYEMKGYAVEVGKCEDPGVWGKIRGDYLLTHVFDLLAFVFLFIMYEYHNLT